MVPSPPVTNYRQNQTDFLVLTPKSEFFIPVPFFSFFFFEIPSSLFPFLLSVVSREAGSIAVSITFTRYIPDTPTKSNKYESGWDS